jgi:hypothetical protein
VAHQVPSALSTVFRVEECAPGGAIGRDHCGYGDLRSAASAVDVWGFDGACQEPRPPTGHERMHRDPWLTGFVPGLRGRPAEWMFRGNGTEPIRGVGERGRGKRASRSGVGLDRGQHRLDQDESKTAE